MPELAEVIRASMDEAGISGSDDSDGVLETAPEADTTADPEPKATEETPDSSATSEKAEADKKAAEEEKELSEAEDIARIQRELEEKNPTMRQGRIRVSHHQAVLTRNRNLLNKQIEEREAKLKAYERYHEILPFDKLDDPNVGLAVQRERIQAAILAETQPQVFLDHVLKNDPRYVPLFEAMVDAAIKERGLGKVETPAEEEVKEEPQPDVLAADGSLTYSHEGFKKAVAYHLGLERAKYNSEINKLREELKPTLSAQEIDKNIEAGKSRMKTVLERARAGWKGFKEHEKEIRAYLAQPGNELTDLYDGYAAVVVGGYEKKLAESAVDRAKIEAEVRAKLVKEMNENSPRNHVRPRGPAPERNDGDEERPLSEVIRGAMREAGL